MQYQQGTNLNAEYVDDKNPPAAYQAPIGQTYQPVIGQPVGQYYQQQAPIYPQQYQGGPQYYPQQYNGGYQQVVFVPNSQVVVLAQPLNPIVAKEINLRQHSRYFYGCNCCLGVLAFIFLIIRCVATFRTGGAGIAAGVMYIISDLFFVVGVICGLYAISRYVEKLLVHYQVFLAIALVFELIGSIIAFATYGEEKDDDNNYDEQDDDSRHRINIVAFVVLLIILILAYGLFIRQARRIRFLMIDLQQTRVQFQNQQAQGVGPAQNNAFQGQGIILQ